jgi:hypothetical protein
MVAGALLGATIGGSLGPGPSNYTATASFGGGTTARTFGGDKPNQATSGLASQAAQSVEQTLAALKAYGVAFTRGLDYLAIGERRASSFRVAGETRDRTIGTTGDAGDLALQAVRALLEKSSGGSETLQSAIGGAKTIQDLQARAEFVSNVYDIAIKGAPGLTSFENEMTALVRAFKDGAERSKEFGLSVQEFTAGFAKSFDANVRMQLLAIERPLEHAAELWRREAQARTDAAAAIGGDVGQVQNLNRALFTQMNAPAISSLTQLQNQIGFGAASAAAPTDQYFTALSQFNASRENAARDPGAFVSAASNLLPVARNFLGTSTAYGDLTRDISGQISQLIGQLSKPPDIVPAIVTSGAQTVMAIEKLQEEQVRTREEIRTLNGTVLAMLKRAA